MEDSLDLEALRTSVAEVLVHECDRETLLRHTADARGVLAPLWQKAGELGWLSLITPEQDGGLGLGLSALIPIYEELGRVSAPLPFLVTMLTIDCIAASASTEQRAEWLPRIAEGEIASLSAPATIEGPGLTMRRNGGDILLSGRAGNLIDADAAGMILTLARDDADLLHRVMFERGDPHELQTSPLWDHGHTVSVLHADNARLPAARAFAVANETEDALRAHSAIGLAAESVGGAEAILELTLEYMKTREQFGRPIGSFQALKHRVADHRTRSVAARHLVEATTDMLADGDPAWRRHASASKAMCCSDFAEIARDCIQLHGGIGFTAEQACHLYLKRANLNALLFGDSAQHLTIATSHLLGEAAR